MKQRLRHQYNISEKQMRRAFEKAKGSVIAELECRLDALVLRAGFARTIYQARQLVSHGHFTVNGTKVDVPSYRVKPYDTFAVRERSRGLAPFLLAAAGAHEPAVTAPYLATNLAGLTATLIREPERKEVPVICEEQLVVEFYSR